MHISKQLLAAAFALLLLPAPALAATVLVYSDHEPLGGMRTRFINDVLFPAMEKESGGRLKIEAYWDGKLAGSYEATGKLAKADGMDMAVVVPEYAPEQLPLHQIFKGFPLGPSGDAQVRFFRRVYEAVPDFPQEMEKANLINLFSATGYPVAFFSTKPFNALEETKGGRWRTASFWHRDFLRNTGAVTVSMPWGEGVFKALQAGELDGLMVNVDSGYMLNVHTAAPNVLLSKDLWLGHVYFVAMNKDVWNRLAPEDKAAIQRAAEISYNSLGRVMDESFAEQVADLQKAGAKVRVLTHAELAQWQKNTKYQSVQAAWVREQEAKGVKNVASVMEKVTEFVREPVK